jgi:hypothetical protein
MELYKVWVSGSTHGCDYSNNYLVVAKSISEAVNKAIEEMEKHKGLINVIVRSIKLMDSGVIV